MSAKPMRPLRERFEARVSPEPNSGCWLWTGATNCGADPYGQLWMGRGKPNKYAHRLSYELHIGPIPAGLEIDHLCRVRLCVNPAHLEAVTSKVNTLRGNAGKHNANKTHCIYGHAFAGHGVTMPNGRRFCRLCRNRIHRDYYWRAKARQGAPA